MSPRTNMASMGAATYLLGGDIGGTNSRLSLYDTACNIPLHSTTYRNKEHILEVNDGVFERAILAPFLQECWETVRGLVSIDRAEIVACLACAGPVTDNKVTLKNLEINGGELGSMVIDGNAIVKQTYCGDHFLSRIIVCRVINDFVAQGFGCLTVEPKDLKELTPGSCKMIDPSGPKVCVGAGTGLGECFLTPNGDGSYNCYPSEGGHVEFSPRTDEQVKLLRYLMRKFDQKHRVSVERVVSGKGLANVYEWLSTEYPDRIDPKVHAEFLDADDMQGKIVSENAREGSLCLEAMRIVMSAYGCEVGSAAIKFIPTGGLFVTGGLTPKNITFIEGEGSEFMLAYRDKGRVSPILDTVPLFAVIVEDLGVRGAHKCASMELQKLQVIDEPEFIEDVKDIVMETKVYSRRMMALTAILAISFIILFDRPRRK